MIFVPILSSADQKTGKGKETVIMKLTLLLVAAILSSSLGAQADCVTVTSPHPIGGVIDLAEWMTMDASLRGTHHMNGRHYQGSLTWGNKIVWTKFSTDGYEWDQYAFDEEFVYHFITGNRDSFWAPPTETSVPYSPRYPELGYPGTRLVLTCNEYKWVANCVSSPVVSAANLVEELWGPYTENFGGNVGQVEVVRVKYYWNCSGGSSSTCTELETNTYARPYGWVKWEYRRKVGNDWIWIDESTFNMLEVGAPGYTDWCW